MTVTPRYIDTNLTQHVERAAQEMAVAVPPGLVLLYWNRAGECRAFSLNEHNLHFAVASLAGVYNHYSEIVPVKSAA